MGADRSVASKDENQTWATSARASATAKWHDLGTANGRTLARYPRTIWQWTTIYSRFQRWRKSGVWDKMFAQLQTALDVESNVDIDVVCGMLP